MAPGCFRFDRFVLDPVNRRLTRDGASIELNGRYFDALALLVREQGRLISKDRFLDEVWRGVPVTDEALTQCVRTLRKQLGDDAARPRFIETAPKYGYRFIAPVEAIEDAAVTPAPVAAFAAPAKWRRLLPIGLAAMLGGAGAGAVGGLIYGLAGTSASAEPGMGATSVLLVLTCLTMLVGLIGGAGVGFGVALANLTPRRPWQWSTLGGAGGGLAVGAVVKLVGLDAFNLLLGHTPGEITGAGEGALLGGCIGFALWLAGRWSGPGSLRRGMAAGGLAGGAAGVVIGLLGGRLMGGSLELLAHSFSTSRLQIDRIGALFGEADFGPVSQVVTGGLEGALFGACVAGAVVLVRRRPGSSA